ncbi:MAG TPA: glucoamylase family protein [Acidobacteriaceae bacterium]|nr:glucoamylase family protein [Acidobacteriaceae bacterium]
MTGQVTMINEQRLREAGLVPDQLRAAAREDRHRWRTVRQAQDLDAFAARMEAAGRHLDTLTAALDQLPTTGWPGPEPLLEIRENPRLMRSVLSELRTVRRKLRRLPFAVTDDHQAEPRSATVAGAYLAAAGSVWNADALRIYLDELQKPEPLLLEELWVLPVMLRFRLLELILEQAAARLRALSLENDVPGFTGEAGEPAFAQLLTTRIQSLREIAFVDWFFVMEPLVVFDAVLREDPAGSYPKMDFDSREVYRKQVARIARYADCSETEVARAAINMAKAAQQQPIADPRVYLRRSHVGYYLVDKGFEDLKGNIGYHPRFIDRIRTALRHNADDFFIGGIEVLTVILIAAILLPLIPNYSIIGGLTIAFLMLLIPATQGAVDLVNNTISSLFRPLPLPRLDLTDGIPVEFSTMVVVPTLLLNEAQVRELVDELEIRCLANPDPNLHFGLLTDLPDSVTRPREDDRDPLVDLAVNLINDLNARYQGQRKYGHFLLLHRHRIFNARQGVWMGWERKRGKLLDLNKLLMGEFDAFPVKAGDTGVLRRVRYIITLDSDTQLPRGTAHALVGAMAHPLNRAVIDPVRRIVTDGYGILQPRVGVSVHSASRSRMANIYSGQTGFDIYTRAISDVYQDLYGEGSFTGKGIYEVATLHSVLEKRFPRNSLLSHDLIEGAYARAGLATDVEVIDDYPSHYSAYTRRKHRWVRGDWQIAQWLFGRVPDESGKFVRNPISTISRWKILDNLRRSLVEPATMVLLVAGWLGLPGGPVYWTLVTLFLLFVPVFIQLIFGLGRAMFIEQEGVVQDVLTGFHQSIITTLLTLTFLPHQTMMAIDAIVRSTVRRMVTGQRLLEWETAAEAEASQRRISTVDRYLTLTPIVSAILALLLALLHPFALLPAAPILVLWGFERDVTAWLNKPPREPRQQLRREDNLFLREYALRVWRFFFEFGGARHNYLIPDNVEEDGLFEAARVSPTNLGLLFNARQAACEFGFLTVPEYAELMQRSYATMARLPLFKGHLYNWYTTDTLEPLRPITVSSVDSGNFVASLYTVKTGTLELLKRPLLDQRLFAGLDTHLRLLHTLKNVPQAIASLRAPADSTESPAWLSWTLSPQTSAAFAGLPPYTEPSLDETLWWTNETKARIDRIATLVSDYLPWLKPEYAPIEGMLFEKPPADAALHPVPAAQAPAGAALPTLEESPAFVAALEQRLAVPRLMPESAEIAALIARLRLDLTRARARLTALVTSVQKVSAEAGRLADNTDFAFLVNKDRLLLSIGYEFATSKIHWACYDMLASEARIATYIAVARGELSQQGWFKMSRVHTQAYGSSVLLSWTGTMFEYLMPALWMRSYPDTLLSRSIHSAVAIQRAYAKEHNIPWGISESGYAAKTDQGHYHYQAYGIPQIALKWDATAGPVVSPYSTFLALNVEPTASIQNLRRMAAEGWTGAYGFYEAVDFTGQQPEVVREWMAHHQGMCILGLLNLLEDNAMQRWFYENPQMRSVELLLHEKPMRETAAKSEAPPPAKKAKKPAALKKAG